MGWTWQWCLVASSAGERVSPPAKVEGVTLRRLELPGSLDPEGGSPMPELPEIRTLARQADRKLRGLTVKSVEVRQPKCLNLPVAQFRKLVTGKTLGPASARGKWLFVRLEPGAWLMVSLGMGGDLFHHAPGAARPDTYQVGLEFTDGSALTARFWWFGYFHAATDETRAQHSMTATLGLDPLSKREFTFERFDELLGRRKARLKQFLLDQKQIAGIGNVYAQDILFRAGLHPDRTLVELTEAQRGALHRAIVEHLSEATALGGLKYEKDLFGRSGRFETFQVGYREGQPCPTCGTTVVKIKTGSTASYICPNCQT
jgi:formamidopyrimidine-DNA glycosylase